MIIIEEIENRYVIQYDEIDDKYWVHDKIRDNSKEINVKFDSKRNSHFIRFTYTNDGKRYNFHKTISKIKWELFGEWGK